MNILYTLLAATDKIDPGIIGINDPVTDANAAINGVLTVVYGGAGILCVIIIIIAGQIYVTSSGDAAHLKQAKEAIIGSVIGLIVILMAFTITQFVLGRF